MTSPRLATRCNLHVLGLALALVLGVLLRVCPSETPQVGFDERFYEHYLITLNTVGLANYPVIVAEYLEHQRMLTYSVLPPMRFMYIFTAHLWCEATGAEPMTALHRVAAIFTILTLLVSYIFARRLGGKSAGLGVLALMSVAPTQIHMSQHALVDGVFAFWALLCLWLLWENLQRPDNPAWLVAWVFGLACMVMTKENSFFAYIAMAAIVITNRWLQFGKVTPRLLAAMFLGPLLGVLALAALAGGLHQIIATYQQSVSKNYTLTYAILTGDGPWHRYLGDLLLVSPVVVLLAIGQLFQLKSGNKAGWFLTLFIAASYLVMCNIKYGINLRYANMWDMPLRYMALCQLSSLAGYCGARKGSVLVLLVIALCLFELRQFSVIFIQHDLYELPAIDLLRALNILK